MASRALAFAAAGVYTRAPPDCSAGGIAETAYSERALFVSAVSDSGAVSARIGFKYQDHVAAHFVLEMLRDRRVLQIECETSDDITIMALRDNTRSPEYVQVKTTDRDTKWNLTELTTRNPKNKPTSLVEKSLLADQHGPNARFRFVAQRSVNKNLEALLEPVDKRDPAGPIAALAIRIKNKHPTTISDEGHDLDYWARHAFWQTMPGRDFLEAKNLQAISLLAEEHGASFTHTYAKEIYRSLLEKVEAAALASRKDEKEKIITGENALTWWRGHVENARAAQRASAKPYRARGPHFFVQIHSLQHGSFARSSSGYDARFERKKWRSQQLARYLCDWIPEVTLRASELAEIDQLNLRAKLEAGFRAVQADQSVNVERLLAETMLHAVLRHYFESEPIACKLYHRSRLGDRVTKNAHVVHSDGGDQLWLGRTHLFTGTDKAGLLAAIQNELLDAMQTEVLTEEREIILHLREPQHMTSTSLNDALQIGTPIDELIRVLCLPILIAYDSEVLARGHTDDYAVHLEAEIRALANSCMTAVPKELEEIQVHVFLVPVEHVSDLTSQFAEFVGLL